MEISLGLALLAGVLSFLAPCVFPLVPVYLMFLTGRKNQKRWKIFLAGLLFVVGFSLIFVSMGALVGFLGFSFKYDLPWFKNVAAVFLIVLGLHTIGIFRINWLYQERRLNIVGERFGVLTPLFVGLSFGLGWSPCLGPIIGGILTLAYVSETAFYGSTLLFIYSMGLAIPFLLSALFVEKLKILLKKMGRAFKIVEISSGLLLISVGVMILTDTLILLNNYFEFLNFIKI